MQSCHHELSVKTGQEFAGW